MSFAQALPLLIGAQIGGPIAGGIAQQQAADYQASVARNNAIIASRNAEYAASAGAAKTEQAGLKAQQRQGMLRAAIGANNLDVNSGSPADVQQSEREVGLLDTATEANNAALQVYGYKSQQTGFAAQAELDKMQGQDALIGGFLGAGSSLLSSAPYLPDKFSWMSGSSGSDAAASGAADDAMLLMG